MNLLFPKGLVITEFIGEIKLKSCSNWAELFFIILLIFKYSAEALSRSSILGLTRDSLLI